MGVGKDGVHYSYNYNFTPFLPLIGSTDNQAFVLVQDVSYAVFKLRVRNSDTQKGKSGGYQLIYYVKTAMGIILLTVYAKSEQVDIALEDFQNIITDYEQRVENKQDT